MQDSASSVSSGASPARIHPHRKLMRKGTRSCTECRRRKIRCIFVRGSAVCEHCSTRGIACIDQRDRVDHGASNAPSHPGSSHEASRDPAQKPSPLLTGPVPEENEDEDEAFDVEPRGDQSYTHPPLVSMLKNTQHSKHSASISRVLSNTPDEDVAAATAAGPGPRVPKDKSSPVCEALRSALPPYDAIATTLSNNSSWWDSFRQKTRVITQSEPFTPLSRFAAQAYTSSNPAEMGMLAVAYTRSLGRSHRILGLVDSLVISDFPLVSTPGGMECLVLLAKTFTDIGQPRRAWLTWRRGVAVAQLMGLHRLPQDHSALHHRIWLAIYHGDRFTSLLLGLPHAVNDALFSSSPVPAHISPGPLDIWLPAFIHGCAIMAGQAIECNVPTPRPSFARAMLLDEQMEAMAGSAPPWWWDVPAECPSSPAEINGLVDRLLIQIFFFHVRMYIHLPFLSSSAQPSSKYNTSRAACVDAARNLVTRFLLLRSDIPGTTRSLFDCKTSDFVGFAATAVLLAGRRSHSSGTEPAEGDDGSDLRLVTQVRETLQRLEERCGCKVAAQCRAALAQLAGPCSLPSASHQNTETTVPIPYLGNFVLRRQFENDENPQINDGSSHHHHHHHHPLHIQQPDPSWHATPHDEPDSSNDSLLSMEMDYSVEYMGYQPSQPVFMGDGGGGGSGWASGGEGGDGFGLGAASLDLDQDWNLFTPFLSV